MCPKSWLCEVGGGGLGFVPHRIQRSPTDPHTHAFTLSFVEKGSAGMVDISLPHRCLRCMGSSSTSPHQQMLPEFPTNKRTRGRPGNS